MSGKLVFVSGLSGAGKTTLVRAALQAIPNLVYLQTTTTRPRRPDETNGQEYVFVTDTEYEALMAAALEWDHTDYHGYKYGADVRKAKAELASGTNLICTVTPDQDAIESMEQLYAVSAVKVWVDTPTAVAAERVRADRLRSARSEDDTVKTVFGHVFKPTGDLSRDESAFTALIRQLLA